MARLLAITRVDVGQDEEKVSWVVLVDPKGSWRLEKSAPSTPPDRHLVKSAPWCRVQRTSLGLLRGPSRPDLPVGDKGSAQLAMPP